MSWRHKLRLFLARLIVEQAGMDKKQPVDVASEPVDLQNEADFMDTGVLHEARLCTECGEDKAAKGYALCTACQEKA